MRALTRYSAKSDSWSHFTEADGLPTHEISALAFDSVGNLYVGTQSDGLLIGKPDDGFKSWKQIKGPDTLPETAFGKGLPSNLVNDVLVADDDTIYVATTCGLARSKDFGDSWSFIRGEDWADKLRGLYDKKDVKPLEGALPGQLLREDYVTGLAEDPSGLLWISYRRRGYEIRRPLTDRVTFASAPQDPNQEFSYPYASTLLPLGDFKALVGTYSDGLVFAADVPKFTPTKEEQAAYDKRRSWRLEALTANLLPTTPKLPSPAKAPSLDDLKAMLASVSQVKPLDAKTPFVAVQDEDWTTQGDWIGRYGRAWADLCAMNSPRDYLWGAGAQPISYKLQIDPREKGNALRYWIHWGSTSNRRALEMPPVYGDSRRVQGAAKDGELRRQSEVDDNGETTPLWKEGPHIYATLTIPAGMWKLSFYNHNKDGHDALNRMRDYAISLRVHPDGKPLDDVSDFSNWTELAHSRQRDFWGGVYKRFAVRGPVTLTMRLDKNNSLNTILAGLFLDEDSEEPNPYFNKPQVIEVAAQQPDEEAQNVNDLWQTLEKVRAQNPVWWASQERRVSEVLARYLEARRNHTSAAAIPLLYSRLGTCYYRLGLYSQWEEMQRRRGLTPARDTELALRWDKPTIALNGGDAFSGRGRRTVRGFMLRGKTPAVVPQTTATTTSKNVR